MFLVIISVKILVCEQQKPTPTTSSKRETYFEDTKKLTKSFRIRYFHSLLERETRQEEVRSYGKQPVKNCQELPQEQSGCDIGIQTLYQLTYACQTQSPSHKHVPGHQKKPSTLVHMQVSSDSKETNLTLQLLPQNARPSPSPTYTQQISLRWKRGPDARQPKLWQLLPAPCSSEIPQLLVFSPEQPSKFQHD